MDSTGGDGSALPADIGKLLKLTHAMRPLVSGKSYGLGVAIQGLVLHSVVRTPSARRQVRETVDAYREWIPRYKMIADLVETIPERWRPTLAPVTGPLRLAALPPEERDKLSGYLTNWRADHPAETRWLEEEAKRTAATA
jgi:hypothetical protein